MIPTLSHTARMAFLRCERYYMYRYVLRLEPLGTSAGLTMGRMWSETLEHKSSIAHLEMVDKLIDAVRHDVEAVKLLELQALQVEVLSGHYATKYRSTIPFEKPEVEFRSHLLGHGFLDAIFTDGAMRVGMEAKLLNGAFWRSPNEEMLAFDPQVTAYFAAMIEEGLPLDRMDYRVTKKPTIKPDSRKNKGAGETLDEYRKRLDDKYHEEADKLLLCYDLRRSEDQIEEFLAEVRAIDRRLRAAMRDKAWVRTPSACTMFGRCEMLDLCRGQVGAIVNFREKPAPLNELQRRVYEALKDSFTGTATASAVGKQTGTATASAASILGQLAKLGRVEKLNFGKHTIWQITASDAPAKVDAPTTQNESE